MGISHKSLDLSTLAKECNSWPFKSVSDLIVSFSAFDQPKYLRRIAYELYFNRVTHGHSLDTVGIHYRIAVKLGWIYLPFADLADRMFGFWWGLKGNRSLK
jgi:hypothetical protein